MRRVILIAMLAVGTATAFQTPSVAQYSHCVPGVGCIATTQEKYNACYQLALQRGLTVTVGDRRNLDGFVYQCLAGKIPR